MDPITLILTALATGAAAGLQPTAAKVITDAYEGLKGVIKRKYGRVDLNSLERDPASPDQKTAVRLELEQAAAAKDAELLGRAQAMLQAVEPHAPEVAAWADVSIKDIQAGASVRIRDIIAGGGAVVENVKAGQDVEITGIRTGGTGTKS